VSGVDSSAHSVVNEAPKEVSYVLDGLKLSLDEEYQTAERLSMKSRQLFAVALGFFTIVQTVAFNAYEQDNVGPNEDTWLFALAIVAITVLTAAAIAAVRADSLVPSHQLPVDVLEDVLAAIYPEQDASASAGPVADAKETTPPSRESPPRRALERFWRALEETLGLRAAGRRAKGPPPPELDRRRAPGYLASYYAGLVDLRRTENDVRRVRYLVLRLFASLSIAVTALELVSALWFRVP
jgi:hypothetical protein